MTSSPHSPSSEDAVPSSSTTPTAQSPGRPEISLDVDRERLLALSNATAQLFWSSQGIDKSVGGLPGWADFTGQEGEALRQGQWINAIHPEDREAVTEALRQGKLQRSPFSVPFRLRRADGQFIWMLGRARPLFNSDGSVREWVGTSTDIHAQRLAQDRAAFLSRAGELLSTSLDYDATLAALAALVVPALADWCILDVLGPDGRFLRAQVVAADASQQALVEEVRALVPIPRDEPLYPPAVALVKGLTSLVEEMTEAQMRQVAQSSRHLTTMLRIGIRSLITVPLLAHGRILGALTLVISTPGRHYGEEDLRFARDLAHRAALSVDNARLYREAQEAIRLRDEFLSVASHELKTPLTPLSLKLQAIERAAAAHPGSALAELVRTHVASGRRQLRRLTALMNSLLDASRLAEGSLHPRREALDLAAVVREVAARFASHAVDVRSPLCVRADVAVIAHWDHARWEQVVSSLLDNALKYGAGTPVEVGLTREADRARLTVRDEGIGIAPEQTERIFERYTRAVSERHYGGLGLGLYLTRTLVEAEGGQVSVRSTPGQGATFVVDVPLPT